MNDDELPWVLVAVVGLFVFYKISQNSELVQLSQIQAQQNNASNTWLTVPGAVSSGLSGIGSILDGFDNLFPDNSLTD